MSNPNQLFERYSRQIFIDEIGVSGQRKLMQSRAVIVGAGGLGSPVIQYLAAAGVGHLTIIDHDQVEIHNLNRQVIHNEKNIAAPKSESAFSFASQLNSDIDINPIVAKVNPQNAETLLRGADVVVDGSDNFSTRYLVNDTCVQLGIPLVYGSIFGYEGQLAVFNYRGSKQLRDLFPEPPAEEDIPNCDKNGVLGPLPGIIGSMMAMQVLKLLTDLPVETNQLTLFDTYHWNWSKLQF